MGFKKRAQRWLAGVLLLGCLVGLQSFHDHVSKRRGDLRAAQPWEPYAAGPERIQTEALKLPVEELSGLVFGGLIAGFRHQAANITYWRMQRYWEDGHWPRVLGMLKLTCFLDPHFQAAWSMLGWHQAYNLSAEMDKQPFPPIPPERYVSEGMESYQRGLDYNPGSYMLYEDAAWTAFDKAGDMGVATEFLEKALLTWDPEPDVTKKGPLVYTRMLGHAGEKALEMEAALEAYQRVLRMDPNDSVGIGATFTIRERYLPAIRATERGDPDRAIRLLTEVQARRPGDPFVPGLLATIYEKAKKDKGAALAAWERSAREWRQKVARAEVYRLMTELGRLDDLGPLVADSQVDVRKLYEQVVWQANPNGMGVLINVRQGPNGETISEPRVNDGQVVRIDPSPGAMGAIASLPPGKARWFLNGVLIAEDSTSPYTCALPLEAYRGSEMEKLLLKVDFVPEGGGRVLWDVVDLVPSWVKPKPEGRAGAPGMPQKMQTPPMPGPGGPGAMKTGSAPPGGAQPH